MALVGVDDPVLLAFAENYANPTGRVLGTGDSASSSACESRIKLWPPITKTQSHRKSNRFTMTVFAGQHQLHDRLCMLVVHS
jgi:hypothetical protein